MVPDDKLKEETQGFRNRNCRRGPFALASIKAAFNARHGGVSGFTRFAHDLLLRPYLETRSFCSFRLATEHKRLVGRDTAGMEIRPAVESDLPALMPLMRGYCDFYKATRPTPGSSRWPEALIATTDDAGMLWSPRRRRQSDRLRGGRLEVVQPSRRQDRVLEDLFVAPEARGDGVGGALIEAVARAVPASRAPRS